ncbi:hypothetical protein M422DRAFT_269112 [Sphaerobolus stellatus SS14]|uniref:Uncharacterized protein n=1 Tax=Sphaerobolus stellatus (strain SS14) TaxID=990650 RepID=A0A0C9UVX1_SPHS4|nr:hypothetical protein M422DRAFT_269112 [Sphaerobolus stellatus SS14]
MSEVFSSHILAWTKLSDVIQMKEIPAGDPCHTVQGFATDPLFPHPAPRFDYENPYKQDEDRLKKVTRYWDLLDLEVEAAIQRRATGQAAKGNIAGPSGNMKNEGKEVPRMPRRTPRKATNVIPSDSKEEKEDSNEAPPSCMECLQKKIPCVPQPRKKRSCMACYKCKICCEFLDKTVWVVLEGNKRITEAVWELAGMEKWREYFQLELKWYELQRFSFDLQRTGELDAAGADFRLLQMLNLKGQGMDILADLEERFHTERLEVQMKVQEHVEAVMQSMEEIQGNTGLDLPGGVPPNLLTSSGKRKAVDEEDDEEQEEKEEHVGRRKKRKVFSDDE